MQTDFASPPDSWTADVDDAVLQLSRADLRELRNFVRAAAQRRTMSLRIARWINELCTSVMHRQRLQAAVIPPMALDEYSTDDIAAALKSTLAMSTLTVRPAVARLFGRIHHYVVIEAAHRLEESSWL